jgi:ParB-like chromosome segregation protein Spo0J
MTRSFSDELARLREEAEREPTRQDRPQSLPLKAIQTAPAVFQPRSLEEEGGKDQAHVGELVRAIKAKPADARFLDPVLVFAIGGAFYCLDGHHRLLAYQAAGVTCPVPVEHFEGSLEDAIREAAQRNSRDRLAMSNEDKLEAAWRLVLLAAHSKREIVEATGASERTIGNMRATLKRLLEGEPGGSWESWREAKQAASGEEPREWTEEAQAALAREWARRIRQAVGPMAGRQPAIFAEALELYSEGLPRKLLECWPELAGQVATSFDDGGF